MRTIITTLSVIITFYFCITAEAQSVYGPGGLFVHPTAYVPRQGDLKWSLMGRQQDMTNDPHVRNHEHNVGILGLDYGLSERTEIGFSFTHIRGDIHASPTYGLFAKHVLTKETDTKPQIALGYIWLPNSHWRTQFGFAVASKLLTPSDSKRPVQGHLGILHATHLNHFRTSDFAAYAGVGVGLFRNLKLVGEARTKTSADRGLPSSIGVVYTFNRRMNLAIGFVNDGAGRKNLFSIGAGYNVATLD
jgi:hypothetical protein